MFKILIVEDNAEKLRNITRVIEENFGINGDNISHAVDSFSSKNLIKDNLYDLLIVDIAIPNRKSEEINPSGGIELVHEIIQRDLYKIPTHIVALTAFDDTFINATEGLSPSVISVIRYSDSDVEWERQLCAGIWQWSKAKDLVSKIGVIYDYDIAIITAIETEFNAVKSLSSEWVRVRYPNDPTVYLETRFITEENIFRVIIANLSQMGMNASAALTMKIIYNFRPKYLFMPGIAASLKNKSEHGFGDVLVIDESWDGGAGKIKKNDDGSYKFEKVALHLRLEKDLSEKMRALQANTSQLRIIKDGFAGNSAPNTELKIHIGSVVSVAGVIANEDVANQLIDHDRKLLGLEMEAYGMYYSATNCSNPKPKFLALKSVCDFADSSKNDDFQNYAAYTSVQVMYNFIISECSPLGY